MIFLKEYLTVQNFFLNFIILLFLLIFVRTDMYDKNLHIHTKLMKRSNSDDNHEHKTRKNLIGIHSHKEGENTKFSNMYVNEHKESRYSGSYDNITIHIYKGIIICFILVFTVTANHRVRKF
jgi:hypothetical protein